METNLVAITSSQTRLQFHFHSKFLLTFPQILLHLLKLLGLAILLGIQPENFLVGTKFFLAKFGVFFFFLTIELREFEIKTEKVEIKNECSYYLSKFTITISSFICSLYHLIF